MYSLIYKAGLLGLSLLLSGCALGPERIEALGAQIERQRPADLTCPPPVLDRCAEPTPLAALASAGGHHLIPLEIGADALAARVHLIRSARERIEIQNYIFQHDESGRLLLDELIAAARRGVRVRLLADALFSLPDLDLLHGLAIAHQRFEVRLYNPVRGYATLSDGQFAASVVCCFRRLNHRMHFKLVTVDDRFAMVGGRNGADRYFDLDTRLNFRDFEVLFTGPEAAVARASFDAYWTHTRSVPAWHTRDLARRIARAIPPSVPDRPARAARLAAAGSDPDWQQQRLMARALEVERLEYFWDPPERPYRLRQPSAATRRVHDVVAGARDSVLLQAPYFVISKQFEAVLDRLPDPVSVRVSTNSLASTDAYPPYAIQQRQRHVMLNRLRLEIFEFKPYPADRHHYIPHYAELIGEKAAVQPAPGPRLSVHAKLAVVDRMTAVVTSHNFDPRSEHYNTENGIIVHDAGFARLLAAEIERDMAPRNAWYVGPRPDGGALSRFSLTVAGLSRRLPTLDLWPNYHTRSYQLPTGADPVPWWHEDFHQIWHPVGRTPEVASRRRLWATRVISRMFGFLKPIM